MKKQICIIDYHNITYHSAFFKIINDLKRITENGTIPFGQDANLI